MNKIIDLSREIENNMCVFPGDNQTRLIQTGFLGNHGFNNYLLEINMHAGTHIDGPMHLTESNQYVSNLCLDSFIAQGCVLDVRRENPIRFKPEFLNKIPSGGIVLLYTGHGALYGTQEYYSDYPLVDQDFCTFLIQKGVKMIGIDSPSPDRFPYPIHRSLLNQGIYLIENLTNLDKLLGINSFDVIALPLKIKADSSPARVIAVAHQVPEAI